MRAWLTGTALPATAGAPGVVGVHFCEADPEVARVRAEEKKLLERPDDLARWVVLVEGADAPAVYRACDAPLAAGTLTRHGADPNATIVPPALAQADLTAPGYARYRVGDGRRSDRACRLKLKRPAISTSLLAITVSADIAVTTEVRHYSLEMARRTRLRHRIRRWSDHHETATHRWSELQETAMRLLRDGWLLLGAMAVVFAIGLNAAVVFPPRLLQVMLAIYK